MNVLDEFRQAMTTLVGTTSRRPKIIFVADDVRSALQKWDEVEVVPTSAG
jgi:hypothetical protein